MSGASGEHADVQRCCLPALKRLIKLLEQGKPVAFFLWTNEPSGDGIGSPGDERCCRIRNRKVCLNDDTGHLFKHLAAAIAEEVTGNICRIRDDDDGDDDDEGTDEDAEDDTEDGE